MDQTVSVGVIKHRQAAADKVIFLLFWAVNIVRLRCPVIWDYSTNSI